MKNRANSTDELNANLDILINGIDDHYTSEGNVINGVLPRQEEAIEFIETIREHPDMLADELIIFLQNDNWLNDFTDALIDEINNIDIINLGADNDINHIASQNTHDTGINSSAIQSIENIKEKMRGHPYKTIKAAQEEIGKEIDARLKNKMRENAQEMLKKCAETNEVVMKFKISPAEMLRLVWSRINIDINSEDLVENLVNRLAEGVEHGNVICNHGKCNKILESLNLAVPDVTLTTTTDIKQTLFARASALRNTYMEQNNMTENSDDEAYDKMHDHLRTELAAEFRGKSLTEGQFDDEMDKWLDAI